MITYLKKENFDDLINDKKVIVDFYADWCGPCNMLAEQIEELDSEDANLNIVKINVDEHPLLAQKYGVMSIPHLLLYNNNKVEKTHIGFMNKDEIEEWIK